MTDPETRALLADATAHLKTLLAFAEAVASTVIDGDIVNGEEHLAGGNDYEVDALYTLVHRARELLGLDDPMNIGGR